MIDAIIVEDEQRSIHDMRPLTKTLPGYNYFSR